MKRRIWRWLKVDHKEKSIFYKYIIYYISLKILVRELQRPGYIKWLKDREPGYNKVYPKRMIENKLNKFWCEKGLKYNPISSGVNEVKQMCKTEDDG